MMSTTNLSAYVKPALNCKHSLIKRMFWYVMNACIFKTSIFPYSQFKVCILRWFGARIGNCVVIKPCVNIKYPWLLQIGDHSWIGEKVWIDNLSRVSIGNNVCISQGVLLLTGSHNYKDPAFGLITGSITLDDGVWIGARSIVSQGITAGSHAVLCAGSVATKHLEPMSVYQGNPAIKIRPRIVHPLSKIN